MDFINEKSKSCNGIYISGIVCGRKINFLFDSGSTASLLTSTEYRKLPPEISHYCKTCNACVAMKSGQKQHKAPLGQYLVGEPMERVALDILGPLPFSTKGNKYILVLLNGERL